jgi:hypothetical protein
VGGALGRNGGEGRAGAGAGCESAGVTGFVEWGAEEGRAGVFATVLRLGEEPNPEEAGAEATVMRRLNGTVDPRP